MDANHATGEHYDQQAKGFKLAPPAAVLYLDGLWLGRL